MEHKYIWSEEVPVGELVRQRTITREVLHRNGHYPISSISIGTCAQQLPPYWVNMSKAYIRLGRIRVWGSVLFCYLPPIRHGNILFLSQVVQQWSVCASLFFLWQGKQRNLSFKNSSSPYQQVRLFVEMTGSSEGIDFGAFSAAVARAEPSYQRRGMLLKHSHFCTCTGLSSLALKKHTHTRANPRAFVLLHLKNVDVSMKSVAQHNDSTVQWARNSVSFLQRSSRSTLCKIGPKHFAPLKHSPDRISSFWKGQQSLNSLVKSQRHEWLPSSLSSPHGATWSVLLRGNPDPYSLSLVRIETVHLEVERAFYYLRLLMCASDLSMLHHTLPILKRK